MTAMTPRERRGMTLMELVIGLAITGMMAAAGAGAFASIIDHRRIIRESSAATERGSALRETIRSWIVAGTIQIQIGGGPRGLTRGVGTAAPSRGASSTAAVSAAQASGDEISFTTQAVNPSMLANVRIRLYIDADANTPEHGLCMEYQPNATQPIVRKMLDSTIDTLHVEYLDGMTHRWVPSSQSAAIASQTRNVSTPSILAVRMWMVADTAAHASPLLSLPMIFTNGFSPTGTGR
jgi:prepilin-type N-terminal cleavage/methylation domain-containing protein